MVSLVPDCGQCFGLCCVALPFTRSTGTAGFAFSKAAGSPCGHLTADDGCGIHDRLLPSGMGGCVAYECFGAGQHVSQVTYTGVSWRERPGSAGEMFAVLAVVRRLHEMLALLEQADGTGSLVERISRAGSGTPAELLALDLDALATEAGDLLRAHSLAARGAGGPSYAGADLMGHDLRAVDLARADLRGALLVAADLTGAVLDRTDLLGADLRDADLSGADLVTALFVTQPQLNTARGSTDTTLPGHLRRPLAWLQRPS